MAGFGVVAALPTQEDSCLKNPYYTRDPDMPQTLLHIRN